ncbi:MAG: hypothetical protein CMD96_03615 [Gammaproteobacteria bacterium]|jgi:cbb3-type cytochrome oxidase cytochrome c subunit|nr:hypothetical protein [Gammaproteobacteria bacterium]HJP17272.1 c-type cytochrome [Nitrospinota bacterium]|tara:strand:- start:10582 stop:11655 length:1074 start_codon:yes stop_codon:yes gene_type:complete
MNKETSRLYTIYGVVSIVFVLTLASAPPLTDHSHKWKKYQNEFNELEISYVKDESLKREIRNKPHEIKQVIVKDLDRVDRCTTCHLGIDNPDFKNAPQPFRTHKDYQLHPLDKFGCTICHAGQGRATTKEEAHGRVKYWEAPMIPLNYIQSACGKCHLTEEVPGAPSLSNGRKLFKEFDCFGCHRIGNVGGNVGPELTHEGRYGHRDPDWLFRHFKDPEAVSPDTVMPDFDFTDEQAQDLTMYMLSLTDEKIAGFFSAKAMIPDISTGRGLFQEKGCIGCHSIAGKGGKIGPDLANVGARRDAQWIFDHFKNPKEVSPDTIMPKFGFTDDEARALTLFVLSLTEKNLVDYITGPTSK